MIDQFNRKINYLRLSVTDRCNLRCVYCIPEFSDNFIDESKLLTMEEYLRLVKIFSLLGIEKVRITGGEPLVRKGIPDLVKKIKSLGIKEIAMTTNGILLEKYLDELIDNGLSSLNISLDTLDEEKYSYITRGGSLSKVINAIEKAKSYNMKIKVNSVIIDDFNKDEISKMVSFAESKKIDIRFIELMSIGCGKNLKGVSNQEVLDVISKDKRLVKVDNQNITSGPASYYNISETGSRVGFISPISNCFCETCNRVRITSEGKLKQCLFYESSLDIKTELRTGIKDEELLEEIKKEIYFKNKEHNFTEDRESLEQKKEENIMSAIGG